MAHKVIEGKVVVDWTTGDPENDRIHVLAAYRDFMIELFDLIYADDAHNDEIYYLRLREIVEKWKVGTDNQIDEVPRIWIKRPE